VLQQGVEELEPELGRGRRLQQRLRDDAASIHDEVATVMDVPSIQIDLGGEPRHWRQRAYEAGAIASVLYPTDALPTTAAFADELSRFMRIYEEAIACKRALLIERPGVLFGVGGDGSPPAPSPSPTLIDFKPKSHDDYITQIKARVIVKSRRHEKLVADYGDWAAQQGFTPSTATHPRDLVLLREDDEWMVEAKIVRRGNATFAVREALGQLLTYRHFLYRGRSVQLVALFSEAPGEGFVELMESLSVLSVWRDVDGMWSGSGAAVRLGLAQRAEPE